MIEFTSENGDVFERRLQTRPKNEVVILHRHSSHHAEHPDCPLVLASIAYSLSLSNTLFSTTYSGVREAHGTKEECEDDVFIFAGVFSSTCKLGGEAASIGRGLQSFARITVANNDVFW